MRETETMIVGRRPAASVVLVLGIGEAEQKMNGK